MSAPILDRFVARAVLRLAARREALCEEFAMSGAFVNELSLEFGRLQVTTTPMQDGSLVFDSTETIRIR